MAAQQQEEEAPQFPGKFLRDVPLPAATLLQDDEFGTEVLSEYNDRVRTEFKNNDNLRIFTLAAGTVHGSNPFACCLIDMIVRPDYRVATPVDIQAIIDAQNKRANPANIRGFYKDVGLALRNMREPNSHIGCALNEQVGLKTELPVAIYLSGLKLVNDSRSPYELSFELTEDAFYFHAPILAEPSDHFDNRHVDRNTGLPTQLGGSERYFYSMEEGCTRIYVGRGGALDTIWDEMANSQADGRLVLVDNRVHHQKLTAYLEKLDETLDVLSD